MATKKKQNMVKPSEEAAADLRELFEEQLKDIYWAEKALTKSLPKMAKNATSEELVAALNTHLEETKGQVTRLDEVFASIGKKAQAKKCDAMEGLLKEADGLLEETEPGPVRDAAIIAAGQKIEHYEIASYGTLCAFAKLLEETAALELLMQTLDEEKNADATLTEVAESGINWEAQEAENDDEDEDGDEEDDIAVKVKSKKGTSKTAKK